ncbi:MAG: DNA polymerase IV [Candidatus Nanohaloarchaea archaeon]
MVAILHIDLDAFFASCEKRRNPELEGKPVVVCVYSGRGKDSGAVSAADYSAREYGIHAGMPISEARDLAEDAEEDVAFLGADKEYYSEVSQEVMDIVEGKTAEAEMASIDEAYALVEKGYEGALEVAEAVKEEVRSRELTASVGIGPNKLVAKMASERDKPDGLTVVRPGEIENFMEDLPVGKLHGVGPKTVEELEEMGIKTVDELEKAERKDLVERFGEKKGISLYRKARGEGSRQMENQEPKQLSSLTTLKENSRDRDAIFPVLEEMAADVMDRVEDRGWRFSTVTAILITSGLDTRTRSTSFKTFSDSRERFTGTVKDLARGFLEDNPDAVIRRVGARASGFERGGQKTLGEFSTPGS